MLTDSPSLQATAAQARTALEAEILELRAALVEARDALVAVDEGPQSSIDALQRHDVDAELAQLRAECDREIIIVQESYEAEALRLRRDLENAQAAVRHNDERLAESEHMLTWLRDELARCEARHQDELAALRQESVFALHAAEDRAAATVAKAFASRNIAGRV